MSSVFFRPFAGQTWASRAKSDSEVGFYLPGCGVEQAPGYCSTNYNSSRRVVRKNRLPELWQKVFIKKRGKRLKGQVVELVRLSRRETLRQLEAIDSGATRYLMSLARNWLPVAMYTTLVAVIPV